MTYQNERAPVGRALQRGGYTKALQRQQEELKKRQVCCGKAKDVWTEADFECWMEACYQQKDRKTTKDCEYYMEGLQQQYEFPAARIAELEDRVEKARQRRQARTGSKHQIVLSPGSRLLAIAEFLYTKKIYTLYFEPIVADLWNEYQEALAKGRVWKARWMHVLYVCKFIYTMGEIWAFSLLSKILKVWKERN